MSLTDRHHTGLLGVAQIREMSTARLYALRVLSGWSMTTFEVCTLVYLACIISCHIYAEDPVL